MVSTHDATKHGLRHNYLAFPEIVAQAVGGIAPSVTPGLLIPILFGMAGNSSWVGLGFATLAMLFLTAQINVFASRLATPGALYVYVGEGLGNFAGIITGWSIMIAYAVLSATCVAEVSVTGSTLLNQLVGVPESVSLYATIGVVGLLGAWWLAQRDIKLSTRVSLAVEGTTVVLILALLALHFIHKGTIIDSEQLSLKGVTFDKFRSGLVFAILSFVGFESAADLGIEAKRPKTLIPRALIASVFIAGAFFVISSYGMVDAFHGLGPLDKETAPLVTVADSLGVEKLGIILTTGIFCSFFAALLACINAGSRVLFVLAHRGLFHAAARKTHSRNATPHMATAIVVIFALVVALTMILSKIALLDVVNYLGTLSTFGFIFAYLMVALAAPFYLRRLNRLRPWHILSSAIAVALLLVALEGSVYPVPDWPSNLLPYIFLVLLGLGVGHFLYLYRTNPRQLKAVEKELLGD